MLSIASSTGIITAALQSIGGVILLVLAAVVTAVIALLGLGFALRHTTSLLGGSQFASWTDQMTARPFKGAHRGYWYRLPQHYQKEWLP